MKWKKNFNKKIFEKDFNEKKNFKEKDKKRVKKFKISKSVDLYKNKLWNFTFLEIACPSHEICIFAELYNHIVYISGIIFNM